MRKPITVDFLDIAKKIHIEPGADEYNVTFRTHSAFYTVKSEKGPVVDALAKSAKDGLPVRVVCDAVNNEIYEADLSSEPST